MGDDWQTILYTASVWVMPVLIAVTLHEAAHGWSAWHFGDDTAKLLGRVTFNPLRHIDPFGTVLLPVLLLFGSGGRMMFGFAKPVPVNFRRLRRPRRDMILVAAAGPASNLLIALISAALLRTINLLPVEAQEWMALNLLNSLWINLLLCVFNMLPLPPLDGGRVAVGLLPPVLGLRLAGLERYGVMIVLVAIVVLPWLGGWLGVDLNIFVWLVEFPALSLRKMILVSVGVI